MFSKRLEFVEESGIRKMFNQVGELKDVIDLTLGQPDFKINDEIKAEACRAILNEKNRYTATNGILGLREMLYEKKKQEGWTIDLENLFVTSGTSGAIFLSFNTLLEQGDEVIITEPYYNEYKNLTYLCDAKPVFVNIYPEFTLTADKIKDKITSKTKLIVLNSPANPTGKIINKEEIIKIVELSKKHNIYVIVDLIYKDFLYIDKEIFPTEITEDYSNLIIIEGFSKTFSMTGWRLGYVVTNKNVIQQFTKIQQYTFLCAPSPFQYAGIKALEIGVNPNMSQEYMEKKNIVMELLSPYFQITDPEGAFYCFPKMPIGSASEFAKFCATDGGIMIVPGTAFSQYDTNFRLSFATDNINLINGCKRLIRKITAFQK
ncbi:pyridoxal phosphate-dependent aminotransferase [Anaeromicropila populeti]|uniref:Aminotransferase n=1 Tax=Anaeromicropila populeti TaxID=37658 RepID=A0A1I6LVR8_9FIRM|nr:aminotransferase class I/II-fold pyridoxal phosphate-dependent enzyme [Anaeromicropila populeti]SFS07557.1 aspartate aminotransferase [Anaeromicropila populeti]